MATPPKYERVVCNFEDCLRTFVLLTLFAASLQAAPSGSYAEAKRWMEEVQHANPVRALLLIPKIHDALDATIVQEPDNVLARLDLVRFHMVTPSLLGGDVNEARTQASEIARRDVALGHFARGYIAYRQKEYGPARHELRDAMRLGNASTRALAAKWLGWLSQETQQWDEAFAVFEEIGALYEIGRTADFCGCRIDRGKAAVREYLKVKPKDPDARKLLKKLVSRQP